MNDDVREQIHQRILQMAFLMLNHREAAEDVAQETILRTLERFEQFRGEGDPFAWACAIAINLCRARWRAEKKGPKSIDPAVLNQARIRSRAHGPLSNMIILETHEKAASAVRGLPPMLRETFVLRFIEDLSYKDIAAITGVSEGAVRLRARRARLALKSHLASLLTPEVRRRLDARPSPATV